MSTFVKVFAAPIMGALFVVFLPVIGFVMVFYAIGLKLCQLYRDWKTSAFTR